MKKNVNDLVEDEDRKIIESIATKYNISVQDLGFILSREPKSMLRKQIVLNVDELAKITRKAELLGMKKSKYIINCFKKAMEIGLEKSIDMSIMYANSGDNRTEKILIHFDNDSVGVCMEMMKLSKELGIPFSKLARYFALNVEI